MGTCVVNKIISKSGHFVRNVTLLLLVSVGAGADQITIPTVVVGDPGNTADPETLFGAVGYSFRIAKYDVTIGQYTAFLNAVAQSDPHGLYNKKMATDLLVAGIARAGKSGRYSYSVIPPSGAIQISAATASNRPITYVSWFDAARFSNWMSNGQPTGRQISKTTENGAYNLSDRRARRGIAVPRNTFNPNTGVTPTYYLPTEDEWYKAAFYNPNLNNKAGGYTLYATNSNVAPVNSPGADSNGANQIYQGLYAVTQKLSINNQQNYLTSVGSFTRSIGPHGTFDMNGSVWEMIAPTDVGNPSMLLRGGAWTSYFSYLQSGYSLTVSSSGGGFNGGLRLASGAKTASVVGYELVKVGNAGNRMDKTGHGSVDKVFWIGKYEVTIDQYCAFLNAIAKTDTYGVYDPAMTSSLNSAGVQRSGSEGIYTYSPINNAGDSSQRPITYLSWFDAARFANWMSNGQPSGLQNSSTTENGAYVLNGAIKGITTVRNALNPNTGAEPTFFIPNEDQWYKAAYYSQPLNNGAGGYYLYATKSNHAPGNQIGNQPNMVNYIDDYSGTYFYSVPQASYLDVNQNYLTDVGAYSGAPSYYGTYDQSGLLYQWNDLDGSASATRGLRGGFYFAGPSAAQSLSSNLVSPAREETDSTIRLSSPT